MPRPRRDELIARYNFAIDEFQIEALDALDRGDSVLVAAPTGSGKTLVAEYAIEAARRQGQRAFYTAPIKALSNQKFNDLVAHYGKSEVGLLTGDNSINPNAPILVMTTEVLRNMIYARSEALAMLSVVVLDEVHFLQDAYRGPVWEEVIIHLDPTVQLVCLSATVSNATEVTEWLSTVRGNPRVSICTPRSGAMTFARAVMRTLRTCNMCHPDSVEPHVTLSGGITTCVPDDSTNAESMIMRADQALYAAKAQGRNRFFSFEMQMDTVEQLRN